jgi:hypothetical protein
MVAPPESWDIKHRKNQSILPKILTWSIIKFQECQKAGKKETAHRTEE